MLPCIFQTLHLLLAIYGVSANTRRTRSVEQTALGERGAMVTLQCVLPKTATTIAFIEWRFGNKNQLVYFDSEKSTSNTGPKGKFEMREVKGVLRDNGRVHNLIINRTVSADEGWYTCRMRDSLKNLYSQTIKLVLVVLPSHPPAIYSQSGKRLSTSGCDNTTAIPSIAVLHETVFLCQVGKSKPTSRAYWERTFPVNDINVPIPLDGKGTMIDVGTLSNFTLKCTVATPSIKSENFTVRQICLRVTRGKELEGIPPGHTDHVIIHIAWTVVVVLIIIALLATCICLKKNRKKNEGSKEFENMSAENTEQMTQVNNESDDPAHGSFGKSEDEHTPLNQGRKDAENSSIEKGQHETTPFNERGDEPDHSSIEYIEPERAPLLKKQDELDEVLDQSSVMDRRKVQTPLKEGDYDQGDMPIENREQDHPPLDGETEDPDHSFQKRREDTSMQSVSTEEQKSLIMHDNEERLNQGSKETDDKSLETEKQTPKENTAYGDRQLDGAEECLIWIKDTINSRGDIKAIFRTDGDKENFHAVLKSGWHLVRFMNLLRPNIPLKFLSKEATQIFKQMETIDKFLEKVKEYGIREFELFQTVDLFEKKNLKAVVMCLRALRRKFEGLDETANTTM